MTYTVSLTVLVLQKLFFQVIGPGHCSKKLVIWLNRASEAIAKFEANDFFEVFEVKRTRQEKSSGVPHFCVRART